ncbi:hypothetical protein AHAS_Ahas20G0216000 [Arachis hypogaea]
MATKRERGLEFQDIEAFNMALLVKQEWRLLRNLYLLTSIGYKYNRKNLINSNIEFTPCYTWRSIW